MKSQEILRKVLFTCLFVALLLGAFLLGYLRGHRSASLILLREEARDHFSNGVLLFRSAPRLAPPRKQDPDAAVRNLYQAREYTYRAQYLLQNRFARVHERQSSYEPLEQKTSAEEFNDLWQRVHQEIEFVETNRNTEPATPPYSEPAARSPQG